MNKLEIGAMAWPLAHPALMGLRGKRFLATSNESRDRLPVEFFAHQLLEVDADSEKALLSFAATYGVPLHPHRYNSATGGGLFEEWSYVEEEGREKIEERERAIKLSERATRDVFAIVDAVQAADELKRPFYVPAKEARQAGGVDAWIGETLQSCSEELIAFCAGLGEWYFFPALISLDEARLAVKDLQEAVKSVLSYVIGESDRLRGVRVIQDAAAFPKVLRKLDIRDSWGRGYPSESFSLTNAICTQAMGTFTDEETEWRVCAHCGRPYKRSQPLETQKRPKTGKRPSTSKYCSKRCQNASTQAKYRAKQKAEKAKPADTAQ